MSERRMKDTPNHPATSPSTKVAAPFTATPHTTHWFWRVRLVHVEAGCRVVEASCERQGQQLAMALGEAATAEEAEDRARERLRQHLPGTLPLPDAPDVAVAPVPPLNISHQHQPAALPKPPPRPPSSAPATPPASTTSPAASAANGATGQSQEPADWSEELAMVDAQLQRLGWDRQQEGLYLDRCFGHPSRSRITLYQDLVHYIHSLRQLDPGVDPREATVRPQRHRLLRSSDTLLEQLGWQSNQGRAFLERHFGQSSRQQLSDEQLQQFNLMLEQELPATTMAT